MDWQLLGWDGILIRLLLSLVCSGIIGLERERHGRAAGLRTTILVGIAATLAMILSSHLFEQTAGSSWRPDPARLAAGILTGMGFLGGGAIIREGNTVRGVTTAAALWFVTILGLAFGSGHIVLGLVGWLLAIVTLMLLPPLEARIANDWYGYIVLVMDLNDLSEEKIRERIQRAGVIVKDMDIEYDLERQQRTLRCTIKHKRGEVFAASTTAITDLRTLPGIRQVRWS
jgi:putative Mg2+ transporter-C (MgtC) family protein